MGPAGAQFFNRKTGINILVDEFRRQSKLWSAAPRQVSIALTNACDLACPYCYATKNSVMLDFGNLKHWLAELDMNGCIGVGFGGGEPTLYPHIVEICSFATKKTKLAVTMTTHAHRLCEQLLNDLAVNLHFVRVSMDGVGSTYESIRNRSFDELIKHIVALGKITRFGINFVVNSKTFGDLESAVCLAEDLGASEFLLLPESPVNGIGGISKETLDALRTWVVRYRGNVPLSISESHKEGFPFCDPLKTEVGLSVFAHIDASGVIRRTSFDLSGIPIQRGEIMEALKKLKTMNLEVI